MIINGQRYEAEPAVEAYVKELTANREDLMRINQQLEEEPKERNQKNLDLQEEFYKQGARIDELKTENKQLEEKYQKATGVIATDSLPAAVDCYKLKKMCIENQGCRECAFRRENFEGFVRCAFEGLPMDWNFGGVENETD